MTFNNNARLDTSGLRGGGRTRPGRGGVMIGGGGVGSLLLLVLYLVFGGGFGDAPTQTGSPQGGQGQVSPFDTRGLQGGGELAGSGQDAYLSDVQQRCRTGADANRYDDCRVVGTRNSVDAYWEKTLPAQTRDQTPYRPPTMVIYQGTTQSACGTASNQVGPFYCPADTSIFIDASFFDVLSSRFGADEGALGQMYVVAHEYGHAIQHQLGLLSHSQADPQGANSGAVRTELMADCLAGMWAKDASSATDEGGTALIQPLTQQDIRSALSAASAVGDDHIQSSAGMRVNPDQFTHGTSEQRMQWFMNGYENGQLNRCNTFATRG